MGDSAPCLLTPGSWLIEQPTSNYRTLLVTVGERKKVLENLTVTIKYSGLEVIHIIIYVHNLLPRTNDMWSHSITGARKCIANLPEKQRARNVGQIGLICDM